MIRSEKYKYTHYLEGNGEELYDMINDPGEKVNLAYNKDYQDILKEHRGLLDHYINETNDNYLSMEVVVDPRWRSHAIGYPRHEGLSAPEEEWEKSGKK